MKKKVKDLTVKEVNEICKKHKACIKCPFSYQIVNCTELKNYLIFKDSFETILNSKVEVEDNAKESN